ncbi:ABC transporter substrate-binding protein [Nocardia panacis]|uniref:ABC transporter substrate-binding protein n=1 Tax=Nocardia panacis TaxID=2340916 RepID=A0A3A4KGT3_9NOCA|nr:ABC transporter substrate-binding protein [Nocardia panacis]RJO72050.1 ABC transporter substrate-binding protein [Nocardia panacis]
MTFARPRRGPIRFARAALVGALALGVAACGSSDTDTDSGGESVTVTHARGTTTVKGTPKKVVALGNQWLDTALALGVTPVAYIDNVAVVANGAPAWQPPKALESAKPLNTTGNLAEQVAALEPDLILVDGFIADEKNYTEFSKLAPTLPALTKETVAPWQEQVNTLGRVLHREDAARKVITGVEDKIAGIAAADPGIKGKTFLSTWLGSATQLMVLTDPKDGSGRVFEQLGMTIPKHLTDQPSSQGRLALSPERVDELDADLLIAGYSPGWDEKYRNLPGYANLPAVKKNSVVFLTVQEITGINQPTALSVPYLLDKLTPALANAAK